MYKRQGRGTTLLWALQYGLNAKGIEIDLKALGDFQRHVKKWSKLHRVKHTFSKGRIGRVKRGDFGQFVQWQPTQTDRWARLICGDTTETDTVLQKERFDLLISDLPYGIEFTQTHRRSPIDVVKKAASGWVNALKSGGAMVLAFNSNLPKKEELVHCFSQAGLIHQPLEFSHRMSESIVRDVVVFKNLRPS